MQTQLRLHSKQHLFQSCFSSFSFNAPNRKTNIRILSGSKREQRKLWFRDCCHKIGISSVVFNSSCFLVRFNYEVLSIHIYFYNLSNGITVKWIRNICFKDIETSTLVEKFVDLSKLRLMHRAPVVDAHILYILTHLPHWIYCLKFF